MKRERMEKGIEISASRGPVPFTLSEMDPKLKKKLKQAVINGNPDRINRVIEQIRINDPAAADTLKRLADEYKFEKIFNMLK